MPTRIVPDSALPDHFAADLREAEDRVLREVKGFDVEALQIAYRHACWRAWHGVEPVPFRSARGYLQRRVGQGRYAAILNRLEALVTALCSEPHMRYEPPVAPLGKLDISPWRRLNRHFEMHAKTFEIRRRTGEAEAFETAMEAESRERARRVAVYAERWARVEARFGTKVDLSNCKKGPKPRAVLDLTTGLPHPSVKKAAEASGLNPAELRKALNRNPAGSTVQFAGRAWRYEQTETPLADGSTSANLADITA